MSSSAAPPTSPPRPTPSASPPRGGITAWLERAPPATFTVVAGLAAFATYFAMYAFRRPFAVGRFAEPVSLFGLGLDAKTLFVVAQVVGYATSKFLGIKVVSEVSPARRARVLVALIGVAELALVGFALAPAPWSALFMLANGLPLGMIWGLTFGFLEGRRTSDLLGVVLASSFIVASGAVKTVGRWSLDAGAPEAWMPAIVGALFFPLLITATALLAQLPPPSADDEAARTRRAPMGADERRAFVRAQLPVLAPLIALYVGLTAFRDVRDVFAVELWDALGYGGAPAILTTAEIPVALGALLAVGAIGLVRDNRRAVVVVHLVILGGAVLVGGATLAHALGLVGPATWMIAVGLGLYLGYVPFNCVLFDRLIAALGSVANASFLITLADAFGYVGSVALLVTKSLGLVGDALDWIGTFRTLAYATTAWVLALGLVALAVVQRTAPARAR
jgi:hypothetical protein